jgi:hypothetical protein
MSSIAEKIKLKLESFEKYNLEETYYKESFYADLDDDSNCGIELFNLENINESSVFSIQQREYLREKERLHFNFINDCKFLQNDKSANNIDKIKEYFSDKILLRNPCANLNQATDIEFILLINRNQLKMYSKIHSNCSTDSTKNFESEKKLKNYHYSELESDERDKIIYPNDYYENYKSKVESLVRENIKAFDSISTSSNKILCETKVYECMNLQEIMKYKTNENSSSFFSSEPKNLIKESIEENKLFLKNFESENFFYQNLSDGSNSDALKTTSKTVISYLSQHKGFFAFFNFIREMFFVFMFIVLLVLDPLII